MPKQQLRMDVQLDFEGPESLYKQLHDLLKAKITSGELTPNQKIPSEAWFSEQFKVSRITVRKAMEMLTEEDLIVKRSGKGSFVCPKKIQDSLSGNISFSLICQANNVTPGSEVIVSQIQEASPSDIRDLNLAADEAVVYIKRVRAADGEPIIIENAFLHNEFAYLLEEDLSNQSLYDLVSGGHPFERHKAKRSLEISRATFSQAKLLNLKTGDPTMIYREVVYDAAGAPLFRIRQVIAGERVRFVTTDK